MIYIIIIAYLSISFLFHLFYISGVRKSPKGESCMSKLKALVLPPANRLDNVCPPAVRELIENYFDATFNLTGKDFTKSEQDALIGDAEVLLTTWGSPSLDMDSLLKAPKLKYIGHAAGTVKTRLPFEAFGRGVRVFSAAARIAESVADWCIASILSMLRLFPTYDKDMHTGAGWGSDDVKGRELTSMNIGIVSLSTTARMLLPMLAPFRCDILAYDPYVNDEQAAELGVRLASLEEVMSQPVVSVHLPVLPATEGMITRELIARVPDGGIFVNSSRAIVLDGRALVDELVSGRIRAALDVYDVEPLPPDSPLRTLPNVMLTPHIAGATVQGHQALMRCVVENIINAEEGRPTQYEVDPKRWNLLA